MQNDRNAFKAGLFILIAIGLMVGVVIAIKGVGRFLEPMQDATITFKLSDDIGGLSLGDEVRIGGARVGTVRGIDIVTRDEAQMIVVDFTIPKRFTIHNNAAVAIQSTVTGVSVLNFSSLGSGDVLAQGESLVGKPSALAQLMESGPEIVGLVRDVRTVTVPKVNTAVDRATVAVEHATVAVDTYKTTAETATEFIAYLRTKIDPIIERYYAVTGNASTALLAIGELFGDVKADFRTTVANLRDATGTVKTGLPPMFEKVDGVIAKVGTALDGTNAALEDLKQVAANTRDATGSARQIITGNRGKIDGMIASLKATGDNLKFASSEIRRSPWRLLYKPGPGEVANLNLYDSARQFAEGANDLNDAAIALRDALTNPAVKEADVQKLVERLDTSFSNFSAIEKQLWEQVRE